MLSTRGLAYAGLLGWLCGRMAEHQGAGWAQAMEEATGWRLLGACVPLWLGGVETGLGWGPTAAAAAAGMYACVAGLVALLGELFGELYLHRPLGSVEAAQGVAQSSGESPSGEAGLHTREAGTLPPAFPNAWFRVLLSRDLPAGRVVHVEALGQHIALYRGDDGVAYALDAYCPHLGANMAVGGWVDAADLVCPFHHWRFRGQDGACSHIPYAQSTHGRAPDFVRVACWHVHEENGLVHLWYDAEKRPPAWLPVSIASLPGITAPLRLHAHSLHHVRAHIQELPENGADTAHLNALHQAFVVPPLRALLRHAWEASWDPQPAPNEHLVLIHVRQHVQLLGWAVAPLMLDVHIHQAGSALVYLNFATPFGRVVISETVLPQAPLLQDVRHYAWAEPRVPRLLVKILFRAMLAQFERDVPIWNHKVYLPKPILVKDDGPIARYRRWFARFYSENSLRYAPLQVTRPPTPRSSSHVSCKDAIDW